MNSNLIRHINKKCFLKKATTAHLSIRGQFEVTGQISVKKTWAFISARLGSEEESGYREVEEDVGGKVQNIAIFSQHEISSYEPIVKCIHIIH